jgi:hypothetical protein
MSIESARCRICYGGEEDGPMAPPICQCKGSVADVHMSCQNMWRDGSWTRMACDVCGTAYRTTTVKQCAYTFLAVALCDCLLWLTRGFWIGIGTWMYAYKSGVVASVHARIGETEYLVVAAALQLVLNVTTAALWVFLFVMGAKVSNFTQAHFGLVCDIFGKAGLPYVPAKPLAFLSCTLRDLLMLYAVSFFPERDSIAVEILADLYFVSAASAFLSRVYDVSTGRGHHYKFVLKFGVGMWAAAFVAVKSGMV